MSFVAIAEEEGEEPIEIPSESDGTILLSSVTAQFPQATGLKYRNPDTGAFRGIRLSEGRLYPPDNGWESKVFVVVTPKGGGDSGTSDNKRKGDESMENPTAKTKRIERKCSDLIILGLPWAATEDDLKSYFGQYGDLLMTQVKRDPKTGHSKGFGFIRFADYNAQETVLNKRHKVGDRWCDVRVPNSKVHDPSHPAAGFGHGGAMHPQHGGEGYNYSNYGYDGNYAQNQGFQGYGGAWPNQQQHGNHGEVNNLLQS